MIRLLWLIALGLALPTPQAQATNNGAFLQSLSGELVAARKRKRKRRKRRKRRRRRVQPKPKPTPLKVVKKEPTPKVQAQPVTAPSDATKPRDCVALADLVIAPELGTIWSGLVGQRVVGALAASKGFKEILAGTSLSQALDTPQATATDAKALVAMRTTSNCKAALRVQATPVKSKVEMALALAVDGDLREATHFIAAAQPPEQDWFDARVGVLIDPNMKPKEKTISSSKAAQPAAPTVASNENTSDLAGSGMMLIAMGAVGLGFAQSIGDDAERLRSVEAEAGSVVARAQADSWKVSDRMAYGSLALVATGLTLASWSALTHNPKVQP